VIKQPRTNFTF